MEDFYLLVSILKINIYMRKNDYVLIVNILKFFLVLVLKNVV